MEADKRPRCPKCGTPARYVSAIARVQCELEPDGKMGKVVRAAGAKDAVDVRYICGGHHEWRKESA